MIMHTCSCVRHQNIVLPHPYLEVSNLASYTTADVYVKELRPSIAVYTD